MPDRPLLHFHISLAPVREVTLVSAAIAHALELRSSGRELGQVDDLASYLQRRETLLVLDNFEHLIEAAPMVAEILRSCGQVQMLITSRSPLRLRVERRFEVLPLAVPELMGMPLVDTVARSPALSLFVERARAVKHDFNLTDRNVSAAVAICRQLDGLPLAIELAAARIAVLPPQTLLSRLAHSLGILTGGARDAPERQRTMRDAIAWSYDLLSDDERRALRRLAPFVGGASFEALDFVCGHGLHTDSLDLISSLVDWHLLITREDSDEPRVGMLEVIREFALERLRADDDEDDAYRRYAEYYLGLAGEAETQLWGNEQARWFRRLEVESANLRVTLEWALDHSEVELALRIAGRLWRFWILHGDIDDWRMLIERALAQGETVAGEIRTKALFAVSWLAQHSGDYIAAAAWSEENLRISRALNDPLAIRHALTVLGMAIRAAGRPGDAVPLFEETVNITKSLDIEQFLAPSLFNLGLAKAEVGDTLHAISTIEEALEIFRRRGEKFISTTACRSLGHILLHEGQPEKALGLFQESLRVSLQTGHQVGIAESLEGLAVAIGLNGEIEKAAQLLGTAEAYRHALGQFPGGDGPIDQVAYQFALDPHVSVLRAQLSEERWRVLRDEGRQWPIERALQLTEEGKHCRATGDGAPCPPPGVS